MKRESERPQYPKWPNEVMLKTVFGKSYLKHPLAIRPGMRVLDVGCFFANNLVPFADAGCECHGVDLSQDMVDIAQKVLNERGFPAQIKVGSNRKLPYDDDHFDLLLSINTLHYEGSEDNIRSALGEFRRVLRPGGALYLSTVGPGHEIFRRAVVLGGHRYRIKDFDFRDGEEFFFFDNERYVSHYCSEFFPDVETGRVTERLMQFPLDFLIAVCR